jgi:hypothetical protein
VIAVLPPEFRTNIQAKKHRELRRIIDKDIATELTSAQKVELPPPVKLGASLADKLRTALGQCYGNKRRDLKPRWTNSF